MKKVAQWYNLQSSSEKGIKKSAFLKGLMKNNLKNTGNTMSKKCMEKGKGKHH